MEWRLVARHGRQFIGGGGGLYHIVVDSQNWKDTCLLEIIIMGLSFGFYLMAISKVGLIWLLVVQVNMYILYWNTWNGGLWIISNDSNNWISML